VDGIVLFSRAIAQRPECWGGTELGLIMLNGVRSAIRSTSFCVERLLQSVTASLSATAKGILSTWLIGWGAAVRREPGSARPYATILFVMRGISPRIDPILIVPFLISNYF
jgi:hypothetical protein